MGHGANRTNVRGAHVFGRGAGNRTFVRCERVFDPMRPGRTGVWSLVGQEKKFDPPPPMAPLNMAQASDTGGDAVLCIKFYKKCADGCTLLSWYLVDTLR